MKIPCLYPAVLITAFSILIPVNGAEYGNYTYREEKGKITIVKYCGKEAVVKIPAVINGNPVIAIGDSCCMNNDTIREILIPYGVTIIGNYAFCHCSKLEVLIIPESVTSIGREMCSYCTKLKTVTIPECVTVIKGNTFGSCENLTNVVIQNNAADIENNAFPENTWLTIHGRKGSTAEKYAEENNHQFKPVSSCRLLDYFSR